MSENIKKVLRADSFQALLDSATQATNDADGAATVANQRAQEALEAAADALSSAGVDRDYISDVVGQLPDSTGAVEGTIGAYFIDGAFQKVEWSGTEWIPTGEPLATRKFVNDKASLLSSEIEAAKKGIEPFGTKADMDAFTPGVDDPKIAQVMNDSTVGNNGEYRWDGTAWIKRDSLAEVKQIKNWVGSETFDSITDMVFSDAGNLQSANLVYLDGIAGTISNLVEDSEGRLTLLRYNRPDNKYITYGVTYDADGIPTPTLTATGY